MAPIGNQDFDQLNSPFHENLMGNVDNLIQHLEDMVAVLDGQEGDMSDDHADMNRESPWNETTGSFNTVLGGLQAFVTGLRYEYSSLERESEELEDLKKSLEVERDDMIEKSHELHCRIQYNALEMKLDQSFGDIERCSSVESARCFKEEAHESLRRTREINRTANLRKCRLDKEIFNEMERITTTFQEYQKERETYVSELDLFDDVRRRKISSWIKDCNRTDTEQEMAESIMEYLDLCSSRRQLEPKIISNTLRMQSMNESMAFDRHDNLKRLDEMMTLHKKVDEMSGLNNILPRKTPAATDLSDVFMNGESAASPQQPFNEADTKSDFLDCLDAHHIIFGHGLHRCPRKINLATDPITDPDLQQKLESALRWEVNDGNQQSTQDAAGEEETVEESARTGATNSAGLDRATDGGTPTTTSEDLQDPASIISRRSESMQDHEEGEEVENVGRSNASLCGDALLSQEKRVPVDNPPALSHHHHHHPPNSQTVTIPTNVTETPMPRSSHLLLHQVESATGVIGPSCQKKLMFGLIKKKSGGGPSSMTAITDGEREASSRMTSLSHRLAAADDRETRSQGWQSGGGRAGGSGTGSNSGNPRN